MHTIILKKNVFGLLVLSVVLFVSPVNASSDAGNASIIVSLIIDIFLARGGPLVTSLIFLNSL